jgi:uncharacterized protein DUF6968
MVKEPVASLTVVATREGRQVTLKAEIGQPYQAEGGDWACPVALSPLYEKLADIHGVDSFHAIWLACSLVLKLLGHINADGWALAHDDGSEFPLESYLKGLGGPPG